MQHRRCEDAEACNHLGAEFLHLDMVDCIYRRDSQIGLPFYSSQSDIFGPVDTRNYDTFIPRLSRHLSMLPSFTTVYAPFSIGGHVDHCLTRIACEQVFQSKMVWYEDFPYCQDEVALSRAMTELGNCTQMVTHLSAEDIEFKIRALACYRSQNSALFGTLTQLRRAVVEHAAAIGGERGWMS